MAVIEKTDFGGGTVKAPRDNMQGIVAATLFAIIFALFINVEMGLILVYAILGMSVVSYVLLRISKNNFTVSVNGLSGVSECGRKVEFEIVLEKKGFCFIPSIELVLGTDEPTTLRTSLMFKKTAVLKGIIVPSHSGLYEVSLGEVTAGDMIGNYNFRVNVHKTAQIAVLPRVIPYRGPVVMPNMLPSEEEESEEGKTVLHGGTPGYEHREYSDGDSLRRVNYKLSAKRGKLMVRMDESSGFASTNLEISDNALPECCDMAFALAKELVMKGGCVKITHCKESFSASTPETLDRMREWLAFRKYAEEYVPANVSPLKETDALFYGSGEVIVQN